MNNTTKGGAWLQRGVAGRMMPVCRLHESGPRKGEGRCTGFLVCCCFCKSGCLF